MLDNFSRIRKKTIAMQNSPKIRTFYLRPDGIDKSWISLDYDHTCCDTFQTVISLSKLLPNCCGCCEMEEWENFEIGIQYFIYRAICTIGWKFDHKWLNQWPNLQNWTSKSNFRHFWCSAQWYQVNSVYSSLKGMNPPNCPELHPIEMYG